MAEQLDFSWEGLWQKALQLLRPSRNSVGGTSKEAIVQRLEKGVQGFVARSTALVSLTAIVEPGPFIGQLMAEAAGLRSNKGSLTPASEDASTLLSKPILMLALVDKTSDEATTLFASLAQTLCRDPVKDSSGSFAPLSLSIGELIPCGGIIGIAKLVSLCPGLFVDEKATTFLAFVGSLVYYSDPTILVNHLGGLDARSK